MLSYEVTLLVSQLCQTLYDSTNCSLPGSPVHGILQARTLENGNTWLPFSSPRDLPDPGVEPRSPALQADSLPSEPPGKLSLQDILITLQSRDHITLFT